ncbi:baculovirus repeated namegeneORF [Condylorrhiza vestigialis mutiple nucleopolyhedrovirus]|uniref:Baculovirus repeated namegeneORF n=1 Tax=Condylorrhiza vestigialis mutiple nucleopolyhedrovirus TaxID=1592576 RepID=A0A0B4UK39_9ABAC|nr:baculovirus repeated namegeneORF [Condylorrhiza vestigialis mutiple nucleopolyhedrovirus]AJD09210.1 baculovirus repeated namegeneORF [Condylorrhiza vestigialis mutiple nucleopolyhedrovirus]
MTHQNECVIFIKQSVYVQTPTRTYVAMSSVVKIQFENQILEVIKVEDVDGQLWMLANPFARVLDYVSAPNAVAKFVSKQNQIEYKNIKKIVQNENKVVQCRSKFINIIGVFELLLNSKMKYAQEFRYWLISVKESVNKHSFALEHIQEFNEWKALPENEELLKSVVCAPYHKQGFVYVVTNKLLQRLDIYKIGYTYNLDARLKELNVASPFDYETCFVRDADNPHHLEQQLHAHFADSKIKREFFKLTREDVALLPFICDNIKV